MNRRDFTRTLMAGAALAGTFPGTRAAAAFERAAAANGFAPRQRAGPHGPRVNGERLNAHLRELARFGRNELGGITRVAYSEADLEARAYVQQLMRAAGLEVRLDAAGNIIGTLAGRDASLAPLMTGSHIDSVPEGGNYDGQVGSMAAIEVAQTLAGSGTRLRHPLEVVIFQNEENGKVGSKAVRGEPPANYLDQMTHSGRTVRDGIRYIGGDPDRVVEAARAPGSIAAFVELHIEQGAILDAANIDIGVVEGIVGIRRWQVVVTGFANHAGTTPMDRRQDALLAAARLADEVNRAARARPGRHVATVGSLVAEPGAANVIAGRATLTLEIRDLDMNVIAALFADIEAVAEPIARETGTRFEFRPTYRTEPADADAEVRRIIDAAARELGFSTLSLPSGAGHDAQEIAPLAPIGMIFIPSRSGISHSAEEYSTPQAITNGADVLLHTLLALDARA